MILCSSCPSSYGDSSAQGRGLSTLGRCRSVMPDDQTKSWRANTVGKFNEPYALVAPPSPRL